ncbi:hypothetical protein [Rhodanobacter sp. FW106-PBR-LB-2-19]
MRWLLPIAMLIATAAYWPGLYGSWLFDDYPNIVDNPGVQPHEVSVPALVRAALSSPASDFKRPLASLSFAANYLASGLNPWSWKLFNLVVHLLNGVLVFLLARMLLLAVTRPNPPPGSSAGQVPRANEGDKQRTGTVAALTAAGWMLLPINLTAVLYVVQREESMANLFVLLGLVGYVAGRQRMLRCRSAPSARMLLESAPPQDSSQRSFAHRVRSYTEGMWGGLWLCVISLTMATTIGLLAKETAAMLPLYAFLVEWILFRFKHAPLSAGAHPVRDNASDEAVVAHKVRSYGEWDWRIAGLFVVVLAMPLLAGLIWLLPNVLNSANWATRDFTLGTRLLSEVRIVCDYIGWTLLPTPQALSFYHDQFRISTGLLSPWTTLISVLGIAALVVLVFCLRRQKPLVALGVALYLGCHVMTGTIIPLELVYEHRNYFASFGVLLAVVPWLAAVPSEAVQPSIRRPRWLLPRRTLLACLLLWWIGLTAATAYAWGDPLRLAQDLAVRAPDSPRAQYELGRTYIMYSHYDPASPYTRLAYVPLEKAASFPESSILPQQALIFMNSRMGLPLKPQWWDSMIAKLKARKAGVQDESSLAALAQCARDGACPLPTDRMMQAFEAALDHPGPSARLQATYGDYAWNVLSDHALGLRMIEGAVKDLPGEPAYHITLVRMLLASGHLDAAKRQIQVLQQLNIGGRLDSNIHELRQQIDATTKSNE